MKDVMIGLLIMTINEVGYYAYDFLMVCLIYMGVWDFICILPVKVILKGIMGDVL